MQKQGWKPQRSIIFCNWDAEEYGLVSICLTLHMQFWKKKIVISFICWLSGWIDRMGWRKPRNVSIKSCCILKCWRSGFWSRISGLYHSPTWSINHRRHKTGNNRCKIRMNCWSNKIKFSVEKVEQAQSVSFIRRCTPQKMICKPLTPFNFTNLPQQNKERNKLKGKIVNLKYYSGGQIIFYGVHITSHFYCIQPRKSAHAKN